MTKENKIAIKQQDALEFIKEQKDHYSYHKQSFLFVILFCFKNTTFCL